MRTIIVNTLGSDFSPNQLFFRAFRDSDLMWINCPFREIEKSADEIDRLRSQQNTGQGYHLVVLTDISCYPLSVQMNVRKHIHKLLAAYMLHRLMPRLDSYHDIPRSVSMIFFSMELWPENEGREGYYDLLKLDKLKETNCLKLEAKNDAETLDFTEILRDQIKIYEEYETKQAEVTPKEHYDEDDIWLELPDIPVSSSQDVEPEKRLDRLNNAIIERIEKLQRYTQTADSRISLSPQICDFSATGSDDRNLAYADLQINLAILVEKLISTEKRMQPPDLSGFRAHDEKTLAQMLAKAKHTVGVCLNRDHGPNYYELNVPTIDTKSFELHKELVEKLKENASDIPGVSELNEGRDKQSKNNSDDGYLADEIRAAWFRLGREKRFFNAAYNSLQKQYDPDYVKENERRILDQCAVAFTEWKDAREETMTVSEGSINTPLNKRPDLHAHMEKVTETSASVYQQLLDGTLEKLSDFEDVRKQAEQIKAEFEQTTRLWDPVRSRGATRRFQIFTLIMAVLTVVVMLVPYLFTAKGTTGGEMPETIVFVTSLVLFSLIYLVGILMWLRKTCTQVYAYIQQLSVLMEESRKKYTESLENVIQLYSELMPKCVEEQLVRERLQEIDRENEKREICWKLHRGYLESANDELDNLRTALRFEESWGTGRQDPVGEINYLLPPYAPQNRAVYLLFR